jgi:hexosaminidase
VFKDIYCAGNDSTLRFLETVLDEVCELFPSNRIHIGGDEAPKVRWASCDKCQTRINSEHLADEHELQTWIIEHVGKYLEGKGKTIIGWDEILEGGLPEGAAVQSWRGMAGAIEGVHLGTDVIASPTSHCYLDYPLNSTDLEEVYSFDPVPEEAKNGPGRVIGGECNMWSERAPQHLVESKVYPRAIGLAEVLWTGPSRTSKEGAYEEFLSRLDTHLNRLAILGVDYGMESIPVSLSLAMDEGDGENPRQLFATITPAGNHIRGEVEFIPSDGTESNSGLFSNPLAIDGPGEVVATINYRGRVLPNPERFPVASHAAVFRTLELSYEPSQYYTGGGDYALVDGRLGSMNFRDGAWQALQGGDMEFVVDMEKTTEIQSLSLNFYRYQDAWIFPPRTITFYLSDDGEVFEETHEIDVHDVFEKNDLQDFLSFSTGTLVGVESRYVKVVAENPGVCPDWHAAATEPTWLFVDELVVIEASH